MMDKNIPVVSVVIPLIGELHSLDIRRHVLLQFFRIIPKFKKKASLKTMNKTYYTTVQVIVVTHIMPVA